MLTLTQKNVISNDIKSQATTGFTIENKIFYPLVIYENQLTSKPNFTDGVITLKYVTQNVSKIPDARTYYERKLALLSINVYGKQYTNDTTKINGAIISQEISRLLINHIRNNWVSGLLNNEIQLLKMGDSQDATDLVMSNTNLKESIYRQQFDVELLYKIMT